MLYFNNLFDDVFGGYLRPKADITENEDAYLVEMDMPGLTKDDVKINYSDGYLTVSITKNYEETNKNGGVILKERRALSGDRSFYLDNVAEEDIKAKFENGVLNIELPKNKVIENKKKFIEIE